MRDLKDTGNLPIDEITASVDALMAGASAAADAAADVKTFRGRSLEALIPQIREELGADAIVLRSSEGLAGGVAGFFQKQYIEVEARAALAHERESGDMARNDRATAEGLSSPGVQALIDGAQPFSAELALVQGGSGQLTDADLVARASAFEADPLPPSAGLYGPQPNLDAVRDSATAQPAAYFTPSPALAAATASGELPAAPFQPAIAGETPASFAAVAVTETPAASAAVAEPPAGSVVSAAAPTAPVASGASAAVPEAPVASAGAPALSDPLAGTRHEEPQAERTRRRLVEAGLSPDLAADLVGEAIDHLMPFGAGRSLERHVVGALARRLPVLADIGPGARVLAFVGDGGSGKTSAAANLAVAYAAAGRRVAAIALGDGAAARNLAGRLEPLGIFVHVAGTGAQARELIARMRPDLAVVDASDSADPAELAAVTSDLRELRAHEVHLALPATVSASAAREAHARQRTLGVTHICLTHSDATACPGAPIGLAVDCDLPISYLCTRATIEPADGPQLAARLLA